MTPEDLELALNILNDLEESREEPHDLTEETQVFIDPSEEESESEKSGFIDDLTEIVEDSTEVPFDAKVSFTHEINTLVGYSEIKGLYLIDPEISTINEYKLSTTYSPQFRIQMSEKTYSFFQAECHLHPKL